MLVRLNATLFTFPKNYKLKKLFHVTTLQSLVAFSLFSWRVHNVGLESLDLLERPPSAPTEAHVKLRLASNDVFLAVRCWDRLNRDCAYCPVLKVWARLLGAKQRFLSQREIPAICSCLLPP